jgi:DHA2 family multidrug resistance protein
MRTSGSSGRTTRWPSASGATSTGRASGLLAIGLSTLQYFLEEGAQKDWFDSPAITACFFASIFALAAFVVRELTAACPVVNLRLFRDPVFTSGTLIGGLMFAMLMANMFLLPLFMQVLLGFTAMQSGLALMPRVLVMMVLTPIVGRLYNHVSPRIVVAIGVIAFAAGSYELSHLTLQSGVRDVVAAIVVQGLGFACLFVPLTTVALSRIPRHRMADATGMNSLVRQIGGAIGLAVFATALERYTDQARLALVSYVRPTSPTTQQALADLQRTLQASGAVAGPDARDAALRALDATVETQASVIAYGRIFLLAGIVFLCVLPLVALLKTDRGRAAEIHYEA